MHPQQLKKKALRPIPLRNPDRISTRSNSYLKTRIWGSRLQNAARILAIVELTQRLHQAYRQAYDKQTAGWLLPQNPGTNPFPTLIKDNLKTVTDAIKLAQQMTDPKKHKECDEALKAFGIPSLNALINGMTANGHVFDGRTSTLTGPIGKNGAVESVAAYFKENKAAVGAAVFNNSITGRGSITFVGDYFFNPASMDWVAFQRAIIMMHESVHQVGGKGDAQFGSSKELSEKIIEKCYPVLKGKLGGVG